MTRPRLTVLVVAGAATAGVVAWGCATSHIDDSAAVVDRVPDGGWENYRPTQRQFEPDPMRAAGGLEVHPSPIPSAPIGTPLVP